MLIRNYGYNIVFLLLYRCLTNAVMAKMNLKGKTDKFAFANTKLCNMIKGKSHNIYFHSLLSLYMFN